MTKKIILIIGATGAIGSAICHKLPEDPKVKILASARDRQKLDKLKKSIPSLTIYELNVTDLNSCEQLARKVNKIDNLIYTVGNNPPAGFSQAVKYPLRSNKSLKALENEIYMHVIGLENIFVSILPKVKSNGSILVIGSAITKLTNKQAQGFYAGQYATAKAAQMELIKWMRRDPHVIKRSIKVHRLSPSAVNTPFHHGTKHLPPLMISLSDLISDIINTIDSPTVVDRDILPRKYLIAWQLLKSFKDRAKS